MTEPFWNTFQKLAVLKNYFSQRSIWWTGVSIKLWLVVHSPQLYQKNRARVRPFEALKILTHLQENLHGGGSIHTT